MANKIPRVAVAEQLPDVRNKNFEEVCLGYTHDEALLEASRCLNCKKPRCTAACPVGVDIPAFVSNLANGDMINSAKSLFADNLLPSVCGRVCPQESQCEGACILAIKGESVAVGKLERYVGDWALDNIQNEPVPVTKEAKVAVVGSGPAGLACAADLKKMGYDVTIFEVLHRPGGVLQYGIPEFRLPKDRVVKREIENVERLGVKIETNVVIGRTITVDDLLDKEGFSAVFIGSGAGLPRFMGIGGESFNGVVSANEFLTRVNLMKAYDDDYDTPVFTGAKVVVVGGGNVAMDAVRTAKRLGADASIVYRRSESELPARLEEVHHAKEEGINFEMLTNPIEVLGDENGWVKAIRCIRQELGEPDASGRRSPVAILGSEFDIECTSVIMALGTSPNPLIASTTDGLDVNKRGCIVADECGQTSRKGVFAGGDVVSGAATVILAMGAGRTSAIEIDKYLTSL